MPEKQNLIIGCVADDFTGASDIASFFVKGGLSTALYNGVPKKAPTGANIPQALVIALKSRTIPAAAAVRQSMEAFAWLKRQGARQLYFKYCSTFDSTRRGNIGPVADTVLETYDIPYTVLCPALPVNGRVVRHGQLLVHGMPLHQSPMGSHPLTPMWDSSVCNLMKAQSDYTCFSMNRQELNLGEARTAEYMKDLQKRHNHFYIVPDCETTEDCGKIVQLFGRMPFLTGGSGIAETLAASWVQEAAGPAEELVPPLQSKHSSCLVLAGSCSEATRGQVAHFVNTGGAAMKIVPKLLAGGRQNADTLSQFVADNCHRPLLLYSSDNAGAVQENQKMGTQNTADLIESTIAEVARRAVQAGFRRVVVAGGETAGAVIQALGYQSFLVGRAVEPGVPVMMPTDAPNVRVVLKSGNFGGMDFFEKAARAMEATVV